MIVFNKLDDSLYYLDKIENDTAIIKNLDVTKNVNLNEIQIVFDSNNEFSPKDYGFRERKNIARSWKKSSTNGSFQILLNDFYYYSIIFIPKKIRGEQRTIYFGRIPNKFDAEVIMKCLGFDHINDL